MTSVKISGLIACLALFSIMALLASYMGDETLRNVFMIGLLIVLLFGKDPQNKKERS